MLTYAYVIAWNNHQTWITFFLVKKVTEVGGDRLSHFLLKLLKCWNLVNNTEFI